MSALKIVEPSVNAPIRVTAVQVEKGCPSEVDALGRRIAAHLGKMRDYEAKAHEKAGVELRKADDHWNSITQLLVEAKAKCDGGGFEAFKEKYCPDLSRSRIYELLQIGSGKKTLEESRAEKRERVSKSRSKESATSSVADSESEAARGRGKESPTDDVADSEPEAAKQVPDGDPGISAEPSKPPAANPGKRERHAMRVAHVDIIELWLAASPTDRTKAIDAIGLEALLVAIPPAWLPLLADRLTDRPAVVPVAVNPALISEDLSIPDCLRRPPAPPVLVKEEPPPTTTTTTADPLEDHPILRKAASRSKRNISPANVWRHLDADELEEVIRDTQRYGVDHADEAHDHKQRRFKQLNRMRKHLAELPRLAP